MLHYRWFVLGALLLSGIAIAAPPVVPEAGWQRLIGALLAEKHETWSTGKRYFDMTEFHEWQEAKLKSSGPKVRSIK